MHRRKTASANVPRLLLVALLCGLLGSPGVTGNTAHAQRKAGRSGAAFLEISVGARQAAIGSAATAIGREASQIFWNPAGTALGGDQTASVALSYNDWLAGLQYSSLALGYSPGFGGTVSIGVQAFGISDIEANRETGYEDPALQELVTDMNTSATFGYLDLALSASYAHNFLDERLSIGATAKYIRQTIDGVGASAVAFDFGSVYRLGFSGWQIAARINHLGTPVKFYNQENPLPLTFSIGTCIYPVNGETTRLMLALDAVKPLDSQQLVYGGAELSFFDLLFLRGGYKLNYSGVSDGGTSARPPIETTIEQFTLGGGLQYVISDYPVAFDYAFSKMDLLDNSHRLSLSVSL